MIRVLFVVGLSALLSGCFWNEGRVAYQGYVEGDYVRIAPEYSGRLAERPVGRGAEVEKGALLFRIDDEEAALRLSEAEARLAQAEAQQASAAASLAAAGKDYDRIARLVEQKVSSPAQLDAAAERRDTAEGSLAAAKRNVTALGATRDLARSTLARYAVRAPAAGRIDDVYFEPGELVSVGQPVVSLLPPGNRRILFFIPEPDLASVSVGDRVTMACDDCADGLTATVSVIASEAEFTPPVIFSRETRAKLVYRIEARPEGAAAELKVGQPIDIVGITHPEDRR